MIEINMQMPAKCGLCPCFHFENQMYCQAVKADKNKKIVSPYGSPRPEWCPLKEPEAVEPREENDGNPEPCTAWWYVCGDCGQPIDKMDRYCRMCGKAVKW